MLNRRFAAFHGLLIGKNKAVYFRKIHKNQPLDCSKGGADHEHPSMLFRISAVYIKLGAMDIVAEALFKQVISEVSAAMAQAYAEAGSLDADHPLSQAGLADGTSIVLDYLEHNEAKLALEHLLYMVKEPPLFLSATGAAALSQLRALYNA